MKRMVLAFLVLFAFNLVAQSETEAYKDAMEKLAGYINLSQYDAIFNLFDAEMQKAMPIEKVREFFSNFKPLGKITKTEFIKFQADEAIYKVQFDLGVYTMNLALDKQNRIIGLMFKPFIPENLPELPRNITKLILPFNHQWYVLWGGDTQNLNYHVINKAQKNAFDILIMDDTGKSFKTNGAQNEDYYCFGEKVIALCDGEVVFVVDGLVDNKPGAMDVANAFGNTVVIKTANNEYLYFCHFKQNSIAVKPGEKVKQGQLLGLCGNSGHSSEPHLHFHMQNAKEANIATGVKCHFEHIIVNGVEKSDYSPVKNEKIENPTGKE